MPDPAGDPGHLHRGDQAAWVGAVTRDSGLGTRDSGLGTRDSGLGTRDSGLGTRDSGLGTRDGRMMSRGISMSSDLMQKGPIFLKKTAFFAAPAQLLFL
ncbi:hypothetical protein F0H32_02060 [Xanthomonas translucens pv. undulosa]|nr:hypothetical protein F0H32_02060 [Xanthomonas translucens pv. undulosa]